MNTRWVLGFVFIGIFVGSVYAGPISSDRVPHSLRAWIPWVLYDHPDLNCPFLYNDSRVHRCAWPQRLSLDLSNKSGSFVANWQVDTEQWVTLPGDEKRWPQQVTVDGVPVEVVKKAHSPVLKLRPGLHQIKGHFVWQMLPKSLEIPEDTGLIDLVVDGRNVVDPVVNSRGQLWLRSKTSTDAGKLEGDSVNIQVYRRIIDDLPMRVVTHIDLQVSGKQREFFINGGLLNGAIPLSMNSALPARLEADNRLRVLLKPGNWRIRLTARYPETMTKINLPSYTNPWPATEVWVFEAQRTLRMVEVVNQVPVDPRMTKLPPDWQNLPAYRMRRGDTFELNVVHRGNPDPEPDSLVLQKDMWLDFDGQGFTVRDQITGSLTSGWRLNAHPEMLLGQVSVDGVPQFITRLPPHDEMGVEVRHGAVQMSADSRLENSENQFNAVGWNVDFQSVSTSLHLPPGWRLLTVSGVDNVPNTWVSRWSLLDLFVVLVLALLVRNLWGTRWGVAALLMLALMWHEPGAPRYVWLNILVAIALLRVLPEGRIRALISSYKLLAIASLILIGVMFMVDQVRFGLYPQLERPWQRIGQVASVAAPTGGRISMKHDTPVLSEQSSAKTRKKSEAVMAPSIRVQRDSFSAPYLSGSAKNYAQLDPEVSVQTGPGLPNWRWSTFQLQWNGPVNRDQAVSVVLQSPTQTLALNLLRVLLLLAGVAAVLIKSSRRADVPHRKVVSPVVLLCLLIPVLGLVPDRARADYPTPVLLKELEARLLKPPECAPNCAQIPSMSMNVSKSELLIDMHIDAVETVAVPLPAKVGQWVPTEVRVNDAQPAGLFRTEQGQIWVRIQAGQHRVRLSGPLPSRNSLRLPLPLRPHHISLSSDTWAVAGIDSDGYPSQQLQLSRISKSQAPDNGEMMLEPLEFPPFLTVTRTLKLGLEWRVSTIVTRVSPQQTAVVIDVPLLSGESVVSSGAKIENRHILVNLLPGQSTYRWESVLKIDHQLKLVAPETSDWVEVWRVDVSPVWHMQMSGIPVVGHRDGQGHWLPEWRPWRGEQVQLTLIRPQGVAGNTLTVDRSELRVTPGKRATDMTLNLTVRSSQGGQYPIQLPENTRLQSISINGSPQPVRQHGDTVILPLVPGQQTFEINWQEQRGIDTLFKSPAIKLSTDSVNHSIQTKLGRDRWVLFVGGADLGPAVLIWGVLLVVVMVGAGLGFVPLTPIKSWQWVLLGVGLSQIPVWSAMIVVAWLMALGWRRQLDPDMGASRFNAIQVGLVVLTLVSLALLFNAIQHGLLGLPEMQISGNNSDAYTLNWYQDRVAADLPRAWIFSVPLLVYRVLMLFWALWLAHSLIQWLRWGWGGFSSHGLWRKMNFGVKLKRKSDAVAEGNTDVKSDL